jgi:hypothetical protein
MVCHYNQFSEIFLFLFNAEEVGLNWIGITCNLTYWQAKSPNSKLINTPGMVKLASTRPSYGGQRVAHVTFTANTNSCNPKKKIRDHSSRANYTDWATAACRPDFKYRECRVVRGTNSHGRILSFLDRNRYHFFETAPQ